MTSLGSGRDQLLGGGQHHRITDDSLSPSVLGLCKAAKEVFFGSGHSMKLPLIISMLMACMLRAGG